MKTCSKCGIEKDDIDFPKADKRCKKCKSKIAMECAKANHERVSANQKKFRQTHRFNLNAKQKKYAENNIEKIKTKNQLYRQLNSEKIKEREKKYRYANSEKLSVTHAKYRKSNKEKIIKSKANYYSSERGAALLISVSTGLKFDQIPEELIKVKHAHLTLLREIRKAKNENTGRR